MIENTTDQINLYVDEILSQISYMTKEKGYKTNQAIEIVKMSILDMFTECMHHYSTDGFLIRHQKE